MHAAVDQALHGSYTRMASSQLSPMAASSCLLLLGYPRVGREIWGLCLFHFSSTAQNIVIVYFKILLYYYLRNIHYIRYII